MKTRIWLLTGLMVLSIYLMVGRQAYADEVTFERFIYDEDEDNMDFDEDPNHTERCNEIFEGDFNPTIPSACYISTNHAYEARIITTADFFGPKCGKGTVLFLVLNKDNDPFRGTCGGSLVKQFQLWLGQAQVTPATEVLIRRGEPGKIEVLLTFPGCCGMQGGGSCPNPPCGP